MRFKAMLDRGNCIQSRYWFFLQNYYLAEDQGTDCFPLLNVSHK